MSGQGTSLGPREKYPGGAFKTVDVRKLLKKRGKELLVAETPGVKDRGNSSSS